MSGKERKRFTVQKTDHHWDKCWGVFDALERRWVMKDTIKRHCSAKCKELNEAPPTHNVNPSGRAPSNWAYCR
jgi:hypothetical protein